MDSSVIIVWVIGAIAIVLLLLRAPMRPLGLRTRIPLPFKIRWSDSRDTFVAEPRHWVLAAGSWFALARNDPWDVFVFSGRMNDEAKILREGWGITTRRELAARLLWLLEEGHRVTFSGLVRQWSALSGDEARRVVAELAVAGDSDSRWQFAQVRNNTESIRSVDFTAWDYVRFIMLCRAGAAAGLLSPAEAEDFAIIPCLDLRARYRGWADLIRSFGTARWFWGAQGGAAGKQVLSYCRRAERVLLGPGTGPLSAVPWEMGPPPCRWDFAAELFSADLLAPANGEMPPPPWSMRTRLAIELRARLDRIR